MLRCDENDLSDQRVLDSGNAASEFADGTAEAVPSTVIFVDTSSFLQAFPTNCGSAVTCG
jgi:hypothetical protein